MSTDGSQQSVVVTGQAERQVKPDRASWSVTVEAAAADEKTAFGQCSEQARALLEGVRRAAGDGGSVSTASIHVGPRWDAERRRRVGYEASTTVEVICDVTVAGEVAKEAMGQGVSQVRGPNFRISDAESIRAELLGDAVAAARSKAERLAQAAGRKLGRVRSIRERGTEHDGGGGIILDHLSASSADMAPEVVANDQTVGVELIVAFDFDD